MEELAELGFNRAVLGLNTFMHATKAIEAVLLDHFARSPGRVFPVAPAEA